MNKQELTLAFAESLLERMSIEDLSDFFIEKMCNDMKEWTMGELLEEVKEYAPELMEDEQ